MHFHHKHDIDGCTDDHADQPALATLLATLDRMEIIIMSAVQDSIDAAVTVINGLKSEVEALKAAQAPAADTSALDAAVAAAKADLPADPAPAAPAAPAVDPQPSQSDPAPAPADAQGIPSVPLA